MAPRTPRSAPRRPTRRRVNPRYYLTGPEPASPVEQRDGRWYIAMGYAGFNSPANNANGYSTRQAAEGAIRFYENLRSRVRRANPRRKSLTERLATAEAAYSRALREADRWRLPDKQRAFRQADRKAEAARRRVDSLRAQITRFHLMAAGKENPVHTAAFDRCVSEVRASSSAANPYAVCQSSLGPRAILKRHRRSNPRRRRRSSSSTALSEGGRYRIESAILAAKRLRSLAGQWCIVARKGGRELYFAGDRFARSGGLKFPTRGSAREWAKYLKRRYRTVLKGWRLKLEPSS